MKFKLIVLAFSLASFISCQSGTDTSTDSPSMPEMTESPSLDTPANSENSSQATEVMSTPAPQGNVQTGQFTAPSNAGKVHHYICPNNCANSGSESGGKCKVCGTELSHNQAFHDQPQNQATPTVQPQINPAPAQPNPIQITPPAPQGKPGVFHYICPDNDGGGADAMGKCSKCGKDLVHNDKFH
ncbi:MAG: hypothetical protein DWQ44_13570 [Bacteroidetes bacterium]|nr:MAG: hypothetical protein DWQ33_08380 [Bacteroidota bacterium]REK05710.1 MAG: hypothetical protein DWQ39_04675 [Bacteroidota bacterium]REK31984.1 MAG: hypothetical protein DWQ44_13570 [Bacteroidota bacterium]REK50048.1 MAG: hypothetical protein DWQ48_05790 [Bacteroidota bacterium]